MTAVYSSGNNFANAMPGGSQTRGARSCLCNKRITHGNEEEEEGVRDTQAGHLHANRLILGTHRQKLNQNYSVITTRGL